MGFCIDAGIFNTYKSDMHRFYFHLNSLNMYQATWFKVYTKRPHSSKSLQTLLSYLSYDIRQHFMANVHRKKTFSGQIILDKAP